MSSSLWYYLLREIRILINIIQYCAERGKEFNYLLKQQEKIVQYQDLIKTIESTAAKITAIDGRCAAGKTTLAGKSRNAY